MTGMMINQVGHEVPVDLAEVDQAIRQARSMVRVYAQDRPSRQLSLVVTVLEEAILWLSVERRVVII